MPIPTPEIIIDDPDYKGSNKLRDKVILITGGDSGIGAATAITCAKEGAHLVISYLKEEADASRVAKIIQSYGGDCLLAAGDLRHKEICQDLVSVAIDQFGQLDCVINNAGTQTQQKSLIDISEEQLVETFRTNVFSMFFVTQAALPHLKPGATVINTTSVTAYRGSEELLDYAATKGAIVSFTRSLSQSLAHHNIRVNAVAPGPVWTPLILSSFDDRKQQSFGKQQPLGRAAQPIEIAPAYVYLASHESRYMTGQVLHLNGGEVVNG